jgi:hypothetical protein
MRSKKLTLLALALLASAAVTLGYTPAANVNRKVKPKRPSSAIGAGGAGTYARRARTHAPTASPTPRTPSANTSFLGGTDEGTGIRRRGTSSGPNAQPTNPANANVNANANASFIGGSDDGTGIRRKPPRRRRRP